MKSIFLVNFFILLLFNLEETAGDGILTVHYISFDSKGKLDDLSDCDYFSDCDPIFVICLRYVYQTEVSECIPSGVGLSPLITSSVYTNMNFVEFFDNIGGVNNPVKYPTNRRFDCEFEISIDVTDKDTSPDDDIDTVIRRFRKVSSKTGFKKLTFSGLRTSFRTSTTLEYKLECDEDYYDCCNTYCVPQNDDTSGHYVCDPETGDKICLPGYGGEDCNIKKCPPGYELNKATNSCVDINECLTSNQCQQICTNTEGSYLCSCEEGFYLSSTTDCSLILLAGTALSSTSVALSWQTTYLLPTHSVSLYYSVYYREVTYYIVTDSFYFYSSTTGLEIVVINLLAYRSYEFYVIATWTNGTNVSNTVTVRTNQDTPSQPPTNLIVVSNSATRIILYWSAISQGSQNGVLVGYYILINMTSNSDQGLGTTEHLRDASSTSYKITDLTAHTEYSISVAAATPVGKGPYSAAVSVRISGSGSTQYFFIDPCNKTNLLYGGS